MKTSKVMLRALIRTNYVMVYNDMLKVLIRTAYVMLSKICYVFL